MDNQEASLWPTNDRMKNTVNKSELKRERVTEFNGWLTSLPVDDMVFFMNRGLSILSPDV